MNTTLPLLDIPTLRQRLINRGERLRPRWTRHWPLITSVVSLVWLIAALALNPLEKRFERYQAIRSELKLAEKQRDAYYEAHPTSGGDTFQSGFKEGYADGIDKTYETARSRVFRLEGRIVGFLLRHSFLVLLPYLLLLLAIGHYKYWYVTRYTLLAPGRAAKWGYGLLIFFVWFTLLGFALTSFGKYAAQAGLVNTFPTLTMAYLVVHSMLVHFRERQREEQDLAQGKRQAELDALKAQVNPPFLFHALQGLHQTAVAEHLPRTTQSLEQLTGIMQYVLEESRKQTTDVAREMEFIRDYLRLQQLRVPDRETIRITTDVNWDGQPATIVPLLLNPLIENAFKHGISIQHPCFVTVRFSVTSNILVFVTENTILPRNDLEMGTGLGLKNVRRRLELAYPERHKLTVNEQDGVYKVELKVKLV